MPSKYYHLLALMFITSTLFAQGNFSASVSVGAGRSTANVNLDYNNYQVINNSNISSYYLYAGVGYEMRRWRLSTGVEFFRTGFHKGFAYSKDHFGFYENIMAHNENIAIPLLLSYKLPLSDNISIMPVAGGSMIFSTSYSHYSSNDITLNLDPWDGLGITRKVMPGAVAKIFAELSIGKTTALFVGPSITYFKPNKQMQYYFFLIEAGITRSF
jgi:hypothetical protein